jgi:hypothetical protein
MVQSFIHSSYPHLQPAEVALSINTDRRSLRGSNPDPSQREGKDKVLRVPMGIKRRRKPGVEVHACDPSTQKVEGGGRRIASLR